MFSNFWYWRSHKYQFSRHSAATYIPYTCSINKLKLFLLRTFQDNPKLFISSFCLKLKQHYFTVFETFLKAEPILCFCCCFERFFALLPLRGNERWVVSNYSLTLCLLFLPPFPYMSSECCTPPCLYNSRILKTAHQEHNSSSCSPLSVSAVVLSWPCAAVCSEAVQHCLNPIYNLVVNGLKMILWVLLLHSQNIQLLD